MAGSVSTRPTQEAVRRLVGASDTKSANSGRSAEERQRPCRSGHHPRFQAGARGSYGSDGAPWAMPIASARAAGEALPGGAQCHRPVGAVAVVGVPLTQASPMSRKPAVIRLAQMAGAGQPSRHHAVDGGLPGGGRDSQTRQRAFAWAECEHSPQHGARGARCESCCDLTRLFVKLRDSARRLPVRSGTGRSADGFSIGDHRHHEPT